MDLKTQLLGTFFYMLYIIAMLQPIMPLIEYNVNKEYIANVLCENRDKPQLACEGKCYLKKQMKKSHDEQSHNHNIPQIDLSKYPVSLVSSFTFEINVPEYVQLKNFLHQKKISQQFSTVLFKPPQPFV